MEGQGQKHIPNLTHPVSASEMQTVQLTRRLVKDMGLTQWWITGTENKKDEKCLGRKRKSTHLHIHEFIIHTHIHRQLRSGKIPPGAWSSSGYQAT